MRKTLFKYYRKFRKTAKNVTFLHIDNPVGSNARPQNIKEILIYHNKTNYDFK